MAALLYAGGAMASTPLSKYGQIQNVQNYSTNPFWSPNGPYNQRVVPQIVYATGPDVETDDCQTVVGNLIAAQCELENNCATTRLSDIRPIVMMQLSRLPGHNYATACAGYIDAAFDLYKEKYSNAGPSGGHVSFPAATTPSPTQNEAYLPDFAPTPPVPKWKQEMRERAQELEDLQSQNGAGNEQVVRADFPKTASDLSFIDRVQNQAAGYAPYANADAYMPIHVESKKDQLERQRKLVEQQQALEDALSQHHDNLPTQEKSPIKGPNSVAKATQSDNGHTESENDDTQPSQGGNYASVKKQETVSIENKTNTTETKKIAISDPQMEISLCHNTVLTRGSDGQPNIAINQEQYDCDVAIRTYISNKYNANVTAFLSDLISNKVNINSMFINAANNNTCRQLLQKIRDEYKVSDSCIGIHIQTDSTSNPEYQWDFKATPADMLQLLERNK